MPFFYINIISRKKNQRKEGEYDSIFSYLQSHHLFFYYDNKLYIEMKMKPHKNPTKMIKQN